MSDVIGAIIAELKIRYDLKYNSSDPMQLTRRKAEQAFTIQDAIMRRSGSMYPSDLLNERILTIDSDPKIHNAMYEGKITLVDSQINFSPDPDLNAIMEFPHKNNKLKGAVYIKNLPVKDSSGNVTRGRYIAGCDTLN